MSPLSTITFLKVTPNPLFRFPPFSLSTKPQQFFIGTECSRSESTGISCNKILKENIGGTLIEKDEMEVSESRSIDENIERIRSMLGSMEDGEITVSAYDTAWVALVEDMNGNDGPQFPSSLEWIANNQLPDGSWGDEEFFSAYDRLINTLACLIALKIWNVHPDKIGKGIEFFRQNLDKLEVENEQHMPSGFEVSFPSLLEMARKLEINGIPNDSPVLQGIYARKDLKLSRIPKDLLHSVPTTLLYTLEGMPGLDWEKLLKLRCDNGSFLFSPSSTAFALKQTKDHKCLTYISEVVQKFGGGVPHTYPLDIMERLWVIDRLDRLGISRYFHSKLKECIEYINRYWTNSGICWARNSRVNDIDCTSMAFRLLRLHGYNVSADVFEHFEKDGKFFTFVGQLNSGVTENFNLYRASQLMFPGEEILAKAKEFSSNFLIEKRDEDELFDKWIIMKDLRGEVDYALDMPWYSSLPRLETRFYLEQYGAANDVWIGKIMYRLKLVNNNIYLELAKMDYNQTQSIHQREWKSIQQWYTECDLAEFGLSKRNLLLCYYLAAANVFEAERATERLAWAKTSALIETLMSYSTQKEILKEGKISVVHQFEQGLINIGNTKVCCNQEGYERLVQIIFETLNQLSTNSLLEHGTHIHQCLCNAWLEWLIRCEEGDNMYCKEEAELIVYTLNLCSGRWALGKLLLSDPKYIQLFEISSKVCHQLRHIRHKKEQSKDCGDENIKGLLCGIDFDMQQLVKLVLSKSPEDLDADTKTTFLAVVRSFYYTAYCNPETIDKHIRKVLFDEVL